MTQKLVQLGYKPLVAWLHQYMALASLMLMYSLGRALLNTLTLGLPMPCTDVTMLQLLHVPRNLHVGICAICRSCRAIWGFPD